MKSFLLAVLSVVGFAVSAQAQPYNMIPDKVIAKSTGTAFLVIGSSQVFTLTDTPQMEGSDFVIIQSTYAGGKFCWAYESNASTQIATAGGKSCVQSEQAEGANFHQAKIYRWWQNLRIYTLGLDTATSPVLRVFQSK